MTSRSMEAITFEMEGSYLKFPREAVADFAQVWLHVGHDRVLRFFCPELEQGILVPEMLVAGDGTQQGMRRAVHEKHPEFCEVCVQGSDGILVTWMDRSRMMDLFWRVKSLKEKASVMATSMFQHRLDAPLIVREARVLH